MADARIVGRDSVDVWHPRVPEPKYVRFAWHANPLHNATPRDVGRQHIKELQDIVFGNGTYVNALKPR